MQLTKNQNEVFESIIDDIDSVLNGRGDNRVISLEGSAGTGKTTVLREIVKHYTEKDPFLQLEVVAPTHKAVRVISGGLDDTNIVCRTIHSFLKLKLQPDYDTGLQKLFPDLTKNEERADILICDESSMVSNELMEYCLEKIENGTLKVVVMVGDPYQLLPVDDNKPHEKKPDKTYRLTEIIRQVGDSPIIRTSIKIKQCIDNKNYMLPDGVFSGLTLIHDKREFVKSFLQDNTEKLIGTYTNKRVDLYNQIIRKNAMGNPKTYIVPGDKLIFNESYAPNNDILWYNSDILTVRECELVHDPKLDIYYWYIKADDTSKAGFKIVDIDSLSRFNEILNDIKKKALQAKQDKRRQLWRYYYSIKQRYADVSYNYASTLHRLQGSTLDNVYLDFSDLNNPYYDKETVFRLMYVGITRARNNAIILI